MGVRAQFGDVLMVMDAALGRIGIRPQNCGWKFVRVIRMGHAVGTGPQNWGQSPIRWCAHRNG